MKQSLKLSVVIPVYKNKQLFLSHLDNHYQYLKPYEVIVVDDASGEGLAAELKQKYPEIIVLEHAVNTGFSQTVNDGAAIVHGGYIFLLNSDVKLLDTSFEKAVDKLERDESLFAVSFSQIEKNGGRVGKNVLFFHKGMVGHAKAPNLTYGLNGWAEGGAAVVRKKYFDELGGFDTLYAPFYWEDIDLSYRAYKRGWRVIFDPAIVVEHHHESTIGKYFQKKAVAKIAFRNQLIFIWKNITDWDLLFQHIIFWPYHLVNIIRWGQLEFLTGLVQALSRWHLIVKRRQQSVKRQKLSDREVFVFFNHE